MNTLELARKLNAIETIRLENKINSKHYIQPFDYLLVLDFEATCWDKTDSNKRLPEIIEFPCVLYDLRNCEIIEEFQQYVMPTESPILSPFCTHFTGIKQNQVNDGVPLGTCLMLFNRWLNEQMTKYNFSFQSSTCKKCVFAIWSDWDLGNCLKNECKRKRLNKSDIFNKWIDVRSLYKDHYLRNPNGLLGALMDVGLSFEGSQHCGLHDARNTAKLIGKMIADGVLLRITKDISTSK